MDQPDPADLPLIATEALAEIYRSLPPPREPRPDDMVRIEVGEQVMETFRSRDALPYGFLPPTLIQGIPVVVQPELGPRAVRVISRAGEVIHEWETPA